MPISGGKYVAPTWVDNGPPAIDATELQAMSDSIVNNQSALDGKADTGDIPSAYTSNPAMNGTASAGTSTSWSRGNHVHPTDTSRAPTSHASSATTYGAATSANYGHVKLSDSTSSTSGADSGVAASPAAVKAVMDAIPSVPTVPSASSTTPKANGTAAVGTETAYSRGDHVHPTDTSRAPTSHAVSATTYGASSSANYGHVRLSDSTTSTSSTSGGYAATPAAVKAVNDRLTYGTTDLTAGTSALTTGVFYAYYT